MDVELEKFRPSASSKFVYSVVENQASALCGFDRSHLNFLKNTEY